MALISCVTIRAVWIPIIHGRGNRDSRSIHHDPLNPYAENHTHDPIRKMHSTECQSSQPRRRAPFVLTGLENITSSLNSRVVPQHCKLSTKSQPAQLSSKPLIVKGTYISQSPFSAWTGPRRHPVFRWHHGKDVRPFLDDRYVCNA